MALADLGLAHLGLGQLEGDAEGTQIEIPPLKLNISNWIRFESDFLAVF